MTLVPLEVGSVDHRRMSGRWRHMKRLSCVVCLITTTCWVVNRRRPRLAPLGHLVHLADSALGRWFQEMMSNHFKPDQTGFGLLCVCACLYVCWARIGCLPHVCLLG